MRNIIVLAIAASIYPWSLFACGMYGEQSARKIVFPYYGRSTIAEAGTEIQFKLKDEVLFTQRDGLWSLSGLMRYDIGHWESDFVVEYETGILSSIYGTYTQVDNPFRGQRYVHPPRKVELLKNRKIFNHKWRVEHFDSEKVFQYYLNRIEKPDAQLVLRSFKKEFIDNIGFVKITGKIPGFFERPGSHDLYFDYPQLHELISFAQNHGQTSNRSFFHHLLYDYETAKKIMEMPLDRNWQRELTEMREYLGELRYELFQKNNRFFTERFEGLSVTAYRVLAGGLFNIEIDQEKRTWSYFLPLNVLVGHLTNEYTSWLVSNR